MADVAELRIKPVLAGNTNTLFHPLSKGLRGIGSLASGVGRTISGAISKLTSIPSLLTGFAVYGAGRTFLDATIGSADDLAMSEQRMLGILGTTEKLGQANAKIGQMLKTFPSLNRSDAMSGMEKFLSITGGSLDKSTELLRLAKALEAVSPEQGFEGAMFALKELMEGDPMSIKSRFGLMPTKPEEAKKAAKKEGKTLSDFYVDEVMNQLGKQYGQEGGAVVDFLIGVKSNSVMGKMQQIKSVISDTLTSIGSQAREPILKNLGVVADKWTAMVETPEFKASIVSLSDFFATTAGSITGALPGLIDKLPGAMKSVMDAFKAVGGFYDRHPTLIKILGGMAAANWVSGGAIAKLGGSLLARGAGKGAAALGAGGLGGCCCAGSGAVGKAASAAKDISFWKKGLNFLKTGGATTATLAPSTGVLGTGALATAAAAAAIPIALGAIGMNEWSKALGAEADVGKSRAFDAMLVGKWGNKFDERLKDNDLAGIKSDIVNVLAAAGGGSDMLDSDRQQSMLDVIDQALAKHGLSADIDRGEKLSDIKFDNTWFSGMGKTAEKLNRTEITVNVAVPLGSNVDISQVQEMAKQGADAALSEKARQSRATR